MKNVAILLGEIFLLLLIGIIESIAKWFNKNIRIEIEGLE